MSQSVTLLRVHPDLEDPSNDEPLDCSITTLENLEYGWSGGSGGFFIVVKDEYFKPLIP